MNPLKKLAGQTIIYGIPSVLLRVLSYLLTPLYTRVLDTAEYGTYVYLYSIVAFMIVVLTYGMETAFFRFYSKSDDPPKVYNTVFLSILGTSTAFVLITIFFSSSIATLVGVQGKSDYIVYFGLILGLDAVSSIPFALLRATGKAARFAALRMVNILVNISFNLLFLIVFPWLFKSGILNGGIADYLHSDDLIQYIFISNLIASAVTLLLLLPSLSINFQKFSFSLWLKLFKYAFPLLIAGLAGIINETFDRVLLKHLLPTDLADSLVGIYGACYKISILITLFIQAFRYAAEPFFFSQANNSDSKRVYSLILTYFVLALSLIFLVTMLFLDLIIVFIGEDFRVGRPVIPILMIANVFLGVFYNLSIWYKLTNQTIYGAYLSIIGAAVTLLLNLWMIPDYGYMGSAWATLVCYFVMMVISYRWGQKHYPVNYNLRKIFTFFGLALVLFFISKLFDSLSFNARLVASFGLFMFYLVVVAFIEQKNLKLLFLKVGKT
ncbi:MAG: polysaccharide biosynthesis C-terminal domain-containing protein [Bacteroidales bacterium]|nr:polysaccharide biosynthesis C-terminal domain-containing protein [Bacteroidales bacterium]MDD3663809.1 polysaccharide biosynthesis C-terminal domain-containing protein [Bacteroidales bacterium]